MATGNSVLGFSLSYYGGDPEFPDPQSSVGIITEAATGIAPAVDKVVIKGNGDVSVNWFAAHDGAAGSSRLLIGRYNPGIAASVRVYSPDSSVWSLLAGTVTNPEKSWNGVDNIYGAATGSNAAQLYVIDYDRAALATVAATAGGSGSANYPLAALLNFPAFVNAAEGRTVFPPNSASPRWQNNGVAIAVVHNTGSAAADSLYALFTAVDDPWAANPAYADSVVVRLSIDTASGALSYSAGDYQRVGKNAFTLEYYNGKLIVASIGGKQTDGAHNPASAVHVVTTGSGGSLKAADGATATAVLTAADVDDEFRSVAVSDDGVVFLLTGHYSDDYAAFSGLVYQTTMADLENGLLDADVIAIDGEAGFLWTLRYHNSGGDSDRLWFARGDAIAVYDASAAAVPALFSMSVDSLSAELPQSRHLNAITLFGGGRPLLSRGYQAPAFASQTPRALLERRKILAAAARGKQE